MGSTALEIIHAAGLSIALTSPSSLTVGPAHRLTPELRKMIRSHKASLLGELQQPRHTATDDTRVTCTECRHLRPGWRCVNTHRADLQTRELGSHFATMRQHCLGFALSPATALHPPFKVLPRGKTTRVISAPMASQWVGNLESEFTDSLGQKGGDGCQNPVPQSVNSL